MCRMCQVDWIVYDPTPPSLAKRGGQLHPVVAMNIELRKWAHTQEGYEGVLTHLENEL